MSKKQNIIAGIQSFLKPRFTSRSQIRQTNNPIRMIGDYINVKQKRKRPNDLSLNSPVAVRDWRTRENNANYESYPQKAQRNRGGTIDNDLGKGVPWSAPLRQIYTAFPITEASEKSIRRYNNRQTRRNPNSKSVEIKNPQIIEYFENPKKSRYNQGTLVDARYSSGKIDDPHPAYVLSPTISMRVSPRRAIQEYRVGQRYANAERVGQVLNRAQQIGRTLAPTIGALGGATIAGMMASRYANNNPAKSNSTAKKSLKKRQAGPKPHKYF